MFRLRNASTFLSLKAYLSEKNVFNYPMRHSLLHHHVQKKILFKRNMYRKDIERTCLKKLTKLISSDMR